MTDSIYKPAIDELERRLLVNQDTIEAKYESLESLEGSVHAINNELDDLKAERDSLKGALEALKSTLTSDTHNVFNPEGES